MPVPCWSAGRHRRPSLSEAAIELDQVHYRYPGAAGSAGVVALEGVSMRVEAGERLGVLGPNGGGKSTLLKLALGLLRPDAGSVRVFGLAPVRAGRERLIGYVPQRVTAELRTPVSVRQVVSMTAETGLPAWRGLDREARRRVDRAIDLVGLAELAPRPIGKLSGGQLQRAMIARAIAHGPRLLLLDEPTIGIDASGQQRFGEMLEALRRELGLAIVTVSHELRTVAATSDRVACLRRTLHYHDAPEGLTPRVLAEVFQHDLDAVFGGDHHHGGGSNGGGGGACAPSST